ncbi:MAG: hypothetical protein RR035_06820 [Oscillibacter sp.]
MPKKQLRLLALILLLVLTTACGKTGQIQDISRVLGVDVSAGTLVTSADSHGGFHGDGRCFVELSFDAASTLDEALSIDRGWHPLPFTEPLHTVVYGDETPAATRGSLVTDGDGAPLFPTADQGYFFFLDRHSQAGKTDTALLNRASYNFTIALYDSGSQTLYYYELDT